ncbi:type IV secretory system conjugative DNA transfer family protein [Streptomyces sp. NBC_00151]|uniref:type IV secretory system conjugative DNA transfer family protein n=1 Tax=Streptomyces sp. NBC_00151 TaxID=2975669 RepID=UPI002DDAE614|nr:type IV secretory system conjugative DNA transfer family protein [Streptomyces sp. NBC_00151]WRZ40924.1 type IV secretory system conjugative DNA transfer family protein [Streptomyces sp. NBC_00151]
MSQYPDRHDDRHASRPEGAGGIPDGLLIGVLGFLLGMTLMVWSATGLAGWFSRGAWPDAITFTRTPLAMRHLIGKPHDIAGAWPDTPASQLSGYGLFWGLFIGQLMVLLVLAVFVMGTVARWRAGRARRRAQARVAEEFADTRDPVVPPARTEQRPLPAGPLETAHRTAEGDRADTPPRERPADQPARQGNGQLAQQGNGQLAAQAQAQGQVAAQAHGTGSGWDAVASEAAPARPATTSLPVTAPQRQPAWTSPHAVVLASAETRHPTAAQAVRDAEGPALVITSDPRTWSETKDARAKLGPVLLYDPAHLCDTPARLHWSPATGCEDKETAAARAVALLAPVRPSAKADQAMADVAETLMRSYLHAAAVEGKAFRHVHRWAQGSQVQDAVRALRTHPRAASGAAGELEAALVSHPERRDIAQELTARALSALATVNIRESCAPNRSDSLALDSFVNEGGTLYLIGEPIEDPKAGPGAMPLLTALASSVVERGRRMAERSSSGRLDPPLTLVLDDIAAVAPLPQLPDLLATGPARGLPTLALLRSREQLRSRWPQYELPV